MTRITKSLAALAVLAGCGTSLPESNPDLAARGVGFGSYEAYEAARLQRDRALAGLSAPAPVAPLAAQPSAASQVAALANAPAQSPSAAAPVISAGELQAAGLPSGGTVTASALPAQGASTVPMQSAPAQMASAVPVRTNNVGISDEQSFAAVSARETIESDAERLARNRANYQVIQPTAVPTRAQSGANVVAYALSTSNPKGQQVYRRGGLLGPRDNPQTCAQYPSADLAQVAFLEAGGPQKDKLGMDPDGDGFACAWDPAPYRAVRG